MSIRQNRCRRPWPSAPSLCIPGENVDPPDPDGARSYGHVRRCTPLPHFSVPPRSPSFSPSPSTPPPPPAPRGHECRNPCTLGILYDVEKIVAMRPTMSRMPSRTRPAWYPASNFDRRCAISTLPANARWRRQQRGQHYYLLPPTKYSRHPPPGPTSSSCSQRPWPRRRRRRHRGGRHQDYGQHHAPAAKRRKIGGRRRETEDKKDKEILILLTMTMGEERKAHASRQKHAQLHL